MSILTVRIEASNRREARRILRDSGIDRWGLRCVVPPAANQFYRTLGVYSVPMDNVKGK